MPRAAASTIFLCPVAGDEHHDALFLRRAVRPHLGAGARRERQALSGAVEERTIRVVDSSVRAAGCPPARTRTITSTATLRICARGWRIVISGALIQKESRRTSKPTTYM